MPDPRGPRSRPGGGDEAGSTDQPGEPIQLVRAPSVADNQLPLPAQGLARPAAAPKPPLEPLFAAVWERAISSSLAARPAAVGAIDVARIIAAMARQRPISSLPRQLRLVSASEISVVVDTRGTMAWFRDDAAQLVEKLDAITRARVVLLTSHGTPVLATCAASAWDEGADEDAAGGPGGVAEVRVGAGGRVIGITDLGLGSPGLPGDPGRAGSPGDPARVATWSDLAVALRGRGASLVIVTPVSPERIPSELSRVAACVHWDGATTPGLVHRLAKGMW
jgi:hypothetical protein